MRKVVPAAALGLLIAVGITPMAGAQGQAQAQGRAGFLPDFTDLYERNGPTVVSIDASRNARKPAIVVEMKAGVPTYVATIEPPS